MRHLPAAAILSLLTLSAGLWAGEPAEPEESSGRWVARVEIRSDAPVDRPDDLMGLILVTPGRALVLEEVAHSVRNLQASGKAGRVEAWARSGDGGVTLIFALRRRVEIEKVRLTGQLEIGEEELRRALEPQEGEPLVESGVVRGVYALQDLYTSRGFLGASVRVGVEVDELRKRAVVTYRIDSGRPFRISKVHFQGELGPFSPEELEEVLKDPVGRRYRPAAVRADTERLESRLVSQGFRLAEVERPAASTDFAEGEVSLTIPLRVGPMVELEIFGEDKRTLKKLGLLPFQGAERYDEAAFLRNLQRLKSHYQSQGHYDVRTPWEEIREEGLVEMRLSILPGPLFALSSVRFDGNEAFSERQLSSLLQTSPRRLFAKGSGRLVDEVLADDLDNIRSFYLLNGYTSVQVGPAQIGRQGEEITVILPIREGPQQRVVDLEMRGVHSLDETLLGARLPLTAGGPFHPLLVDQALDGLRGAYEEVGFESVQVDAHLDWDDTGTLVDVEIRVLEGPRSIVDRVILRGNSTTHSPVVRRAMDLDEGMAINTRRLLEVQQKLYGLGVFSSVDVRRSPGTPFSGRRDVIVRVEEGNRNRVTYGVGYDSDDGLRGLLGLTRSNLFGRAITARIDLRVSQADDEARLIVRQPYVGRWKLPVSYSIFNVKEAQGSFDSRRRGGQVEVRRFSDHIRSGLLYTYNLVEVLNADPALEEIAIDRNLRDARISSLTPNVLFDYRDDPFDPTRGWSTAAELEYAFPLFQADTEFLRLFFQQTGYVPMGRLGVLGASFRWGAIEPLSPFVEDPTLPPELESRLVPIAERYFAGGRTTHRAYGRDSLGIPHETLLVDVDEDDPGAVPRTVSIGGNGLLLLNLDYRFPIVGPVGGTLFIDSGNVWSDWRNVNLSEIKTGTGLGIRYRSPIGPVRLEAGWKLDPLRVSDLTPHDLVVGDQVGSDRPDADELVESRWAFFFSFGYAF